MSSPASPLWYGLRGRCPACGGGKLFKGMLAIQERCSQCNLALDRSDVGDGAPYFVIMVMSVLTSVLGIWVEFRFEPPLWLHVIVWAPFILIGSIFLLRLLKGWLVSSQYRHRRDVFEGDTHA